MDSILGYRQHHRAPKSPLSGGLSLEPVACSYSLAWFSSLLLAYLAVSVLTATDVGGKSSG